MGLPRSTFYDQPGDQHGCNRAAGPPDGPVRRVRRLRLSTRRSGLAPAEDRRQRQEAAPPDARARPAAAPAPTVQGDDRQRPRPARLPERGGRAGADGPNQLWIADLTYIAVPNGFVYLAVILDAWSRKAVGYAVSRSLEARTAVAALEAALAARSPPKGCVHHSDRGSQGGFKWSPQRLGGGRL
jgi:putative transposase